MARLCSECNTPLTGTHPRKKTCSDACRAKRSRRLATQQRERSQKGSEALTLAPEQREAGQRVDLNHGHDERIPDVASEVIREELRPVVRANLTDDTLKAIKDMIGLTPAAVEAIKQDLSSTDAAVRQRAYTIVAKYTLDPKAIGAPKEEGEGQKLNVLFNLPRPGDEVKEVEAAVDIDSTETKVCDQCSEEKLVNEFVAGTTRCLKCYQSNQGKATDLLEQLSQS